MNLKLSFSCIGLAIFALPMLINVFYAVFPPKEETEGGKAVTRWVEIAEQVSRIAYLIAVTCLTSREAVSLRSAWLYIGGLFLVMYYAVWIRYFAGGRKLLLLRKSFLSVPMPLVVFPVLYYLCAAVWLHNLPAAVIMVIFGAAHLTVSVQSFR